MKKIFNFVLCAGAAFLAVTGCQKDMDTTSGSEARVVSFCATEMETKTQFGDKAGDKYPTLWTTNQKVLVNLSYKKGLELEVTPSDDGATATFNGDFSSVTEGPYTFMSVSPASAKDANFNEANKRVGVNVRVNQTPLANSVDERVQILVAKSEEFTEFPTSADLTYSHVVAYGKMTLKNLGLEDGEKVSSISLTASEDFAGPYYYYFDDLTVDDVLTAEEGTLEPRGSNSTTITLNTSSVENVWFACAPVDLSDGGTMEIVVTTDNGTYTKEVTFPADAGNFEAGKVASFTVNMNGIECVKQQCRWERVTEEPADWSGTYVVAIVELNKANPRAWNMKLENKNLIFLTLTGDYNAITAARTVNNGSNDISLEDLKTKYAVTIAKYNEGYSIQMADGKYMTRNTQGPGLDQTDTPSCGATDINFDATDNTVRFNIVTDAPAVSVGFGFNPTGGNNRFNYFPSDKWDDKSRVSLYKYVE